MNLNKRTMTLDLLPLHRKGIISSINFDAVPLKLIEIGCLPGNEIEVLHIAPLNDPIYILVNESHISIRKELAKEIVVEII